MVQAFEVMSVEDSRVMDVSLSNTSTEGVQSTSRSWKGRLLLAVAPVLGVALLAAAVLQGLASIPGGTSNIHIDSGLRGVNEETSFRKILTENAYQSPLKDFPALKVPQDPEERRPGLKCVEDFDIVPWNFAKTDSKLGKRLKQGLVYCGHSFSEPSDARTQNTRFWSGSHWKFYCDASNGADASELGEITTDASNGADASELGEVTTAVRVLEDVVESKKEEFFAFYLQARPHSRMEAEWVDGEFYVGLRRPAAAARSLHDLRDGLEKSEGGFNLNLLRVVHSALRQLPHFYDRTGCSFHGGITAHTIEVLVDGGDKPLMAYVTGCADAIHWHMGWRSSLLGLGTFWARHMPPEIYGQSARNRFSSKIDTWSVGLAMIDMVHRQHMKSSFHEWSNPRHFLFFESCAFLFHNSLRVQTNPLILHSSTMKFVDEFLKVSEDETGRAVKEVLTKMIASDPEDRWDVDTALVRIGEVIQGLEAEELDRKTPTEDEKEESKAQEKEQLQDVIQSDRL